MNKKSGFIPSLIEGEQRYSTKINQKLFGESPRLEPKITSLINDISFFRDIENDFTGNDFQKERRDVLDLASEAEALLKETIRIENNSEPFCLAVIGDFSSGKSTFINSLLQKEVCPMAVGRSTSSITRFKYAPELQIQQITSQGNGDKKDKMICDEEKYKELVAHGDEGNALEFDYYYPWRELRDITIIDTPGFNSVTDLSDGKSKKKGGDSALTEKVVKEEADVILWVFDVSKGNFGGDQIKRMKALKEGNAKDLKIFVMLNKADTKRNLSERREILDELRKSVGDLIEGSFFYSATKVLENREGKKEGVDLDEYLKKLRKNQQDFLTLKVKKEPNDSVAELIIEQSSGFVWHFSSTPSSVDQLIVEQNKRECDVIPLSFDENDIPQEIDLINYDQILEKLHNLKQKKPEFLRARLKKNEDQYLERKEKVLTSFKQSIEKKQRENEPSDDALESGVAEYRRLVERWKKRVKRSFEESVDIPQKIKKIHDYWVETKCGFLGDKITFKHQSFRKRVIKRLNEKSERIFKDVYLKDVEKFLEDDRIQGSKVDVKFLQQLQKYLKEWHLNGSSEIYKLVDDLKKNYQKFSTLITCGSDHDIYELSSYSDDKISINEGVRVAVESFKDAIYAKFLTVFDEDLTRCENYEEGVKNDLKAKYKLVLKKIKENCKN